MKFRCSRDCHIKRRKRIAVLDHCFQTKHRVIVETVNRGRRSVLSAEILAHDPAGPDYDR